jgi:hypothetical protein
MTVTKNIKRAAFRISCGDANARLSRAHANWKRCLLEEAHMQPEVQIRERIHGGPDLRVGLVSEAGSTDSKRTPRGEYPVLKSKG